MDSWGVSANAVEKDYSNAVSGSLMSTFNASLLNEFRFQFAREDRPRPYDGPDITGQAGRCPTPRSTSASGYRFGEPFFIPVDYHDDRMQFNENISYQGPPHVQGGSRIQPRSSASRRSWDSPTAARSSARRTDS